VTVVDDDDLILVNEIPVSAPFRMDVHDDCRHLDHAHAGRHHRAHVDREVDIGRARHVAACQHRLPDLGALLSRQADVAAAGLALLSLTLRARAGLALRRGRLTLLTLALLTLWRLALRLLALHLILALVALTLAGGLVALT